jgi:hypothetical protein
LTVGKGVRIICATFHFIGNKTVEFSLWT